MPRLALNSKNHDLLVKFAMLAFLLMVVGNYVLAALSIPATPEMSKLQDGLLFLVTGLVISPKDEAADGETAETELQPPAAPATIAAV